MTRRRWNGTDPVVGIDIDGTLGRYHEHFLTFAAAWLGVQGWPGSKAYRAEWQRLEMGPPRLLEHDMYDGWSSLAEFMGISKARYRQCKLAYRRGGLKRSMPLYPGARDMMVALRRRAWVVVCTTRPYLHLDNIEPDTTEWLRRNRIPYDALLMGEHKYRDLRRQYGTQVAAVVDDDPALLAQARDLSPSVPALLMLRTHNVHHWNGYWWAADGCSSATKLLLEHLKRADWMLGVQPINN